MIYLIGGAPRVGKSIMAKRLAEKKECDFISTDELVEKIEKILSEDERSKAFPWKGFSGDPSKNTLTPEERVELQEVCARSIEPEIDRLIHEALKDGRGLILEGVHLLPEHVKRLVGEFGEDKFQIVFVGYTEVERVLNGLVKNQNADDWLKGSDDEVKRQVAEYTVAQSRRVKEGAEQNDFTYFERTDDFEGDLSRIISGELMNAS